MLRIKKTNIAPTMRLVLRGTVHEDLDTAPWFERGGLFIGVVGTDACLSENRNISAMVGSGSRNSHLLTRGWLDWGDFKGIRSGSSGAGKSGPADCFEAA